MKNAEIINMLNEVDKYLNRNLNRNFKVKNTDDIGVRIYIRTMNMIGNELRTKRVGASIRNRYMQTMNALLYATDRGRLDQNNRYFYWLVNMDKPQLLYKQLFYEVATGHMSNYQLSYLKENLPKDLPNREELLHNIQNIQKEYDEFLEQDNVKGRRTEKALTVIKNNPIMDIVKFFKKVFANRKEKRGLESSNNYNINGNNKVNNSNRHEEYCNQLKDNRNYSKHHQTENRTYPEQVIAVSDLHGNMEKWEAVKNYMQTNPNMKLLILGDALDRGDSGLQILLQIKELCDQGKAEYLPGNHDIFAYNYVKGNEILSRIPDNEKAQNQDIISIVGRATGNLLGNGGENTIKGLDEFNKIVNEEIRNRNIQNKITKKELIDWLGKQPIQKKTTISGTKYALAHAYFDDELYNQDPSFNLEKALKMKIKGDNTTLLNKFETVMWYRKEDDRTHYAPVKFPDGCVMVVGHTRQPEGVNVKNFSNNNKYEPMIYIDTGNSIYSAFDLTNGRVTDLENTQYDNSR